MAVETNTPLTTPTGFLGHDAGPNPGKMTPTQAQTLLATAGALPVTAGGTGGTTQATARAGLGLVIDTDVASKSFQTISVSGQSNVVADVAADTLTLIGAGSVAITTNAAGDAVTFSGSGGGATALTGVVTYDAPNLVAAADTSIGTITVTGAVLGDFVMASLDVDIQGIIVVAWVSAADTVSYRLQNETAGTIDLASANLRVVVWQKSNWTFTASGTTEWLASTQVIPSGFTFARTGVGLYLWHASSFASAGYQSAASDVARFERLPSGSIGWLGEGQATNLFPKSYDLRIDTTNWVDVNGVIATLDQPGLTGSANTATLLNDNSATQRTGIGTTGMTIPTAASVFLMRTFTLKDSATTRFPEFDAVFSPGNNQVWEAYDTNSTAGSGAGSVADLGAGGANITPTFYVRSRGLWWEVGFHGTKPAGDTSATITQFPARCATFGGAMAVATQGSMVVGNMDFVMDTRVRTSPIQTSGTIATRNAETASKTSVTPPASYAVALVVRTASGRVSGTDQYIYSHDDGTAANRIQLYRQGSSGQMFLSIITGSTQQIGPLSNSVVTADDTEYKISFSIAANSVNLCVGSTLSTRDTTVSLPTVTIQRFFTDHASANHWNGHLISGKFGPSWLAAQNDAGLQALNA